MVCWSPARRIDSRRNAYICAQQLRNSFRTAIFLQLSPRYYGAWLSIRRTLSRGLGTSRFTHGAIRSGSSHGVPDIHHLY